MKILKAEFEKGFVTVKINVNDDLWYLREIIESGDIVKAKTLRSLFLLREGRKEKVGKKPMVLKVRVEKVEYKKHANRLRLMGKIIEGPEDVQIGSYHSIEVSIGSVLTIYKKEWKKFQMKKIEKAQTKVPELLIVVTDMNRATVGLIKRFRVEIILELRNPHSIQEEDKLLEFYKKIASEIDKHSEKVKKIILAGPGFAKEHVQKIIEEKFPEIKNKLIVDSTSSATRAGINEILKRGTLDRIIKESEIIKESQIIQEFFTHLQKDDGLAVYGLEQIKEADNAGAVKILIVSEEKIREDEVDRLASQVEKKKGRVEIVSRTHELGDQFYRMGGLGAILRFRVR
jgi:protein pelota